MTKKSILLIVKVFFSGLLLIHIVREVDYKLVVDAVEEARLIPLVLALLLIIPAQLLNAYRWHAILLALKSPLPFLSILRFTNNGTIANFIIPGSFGGEATRGILAARQVKNIPTVLVSLVQEKLSLLSAVGLFLFLSPVLASQSISPTTIKITGASITILSISIMLVLSHPNLLKKLPIPPLLIPTNNIPLNSLTGIILLGITQQSVYVLGAILYAMVFEINIPLHAWFGINGIVTLLNLLPISFKGLGINENAYASLLNPYDIPTSVSVVYSLSGFFLLGVMNILFWLSIEVISLPKLNTRTKT